MKITSLHLAYWAWHKAPSWAQGISPKRNHPSVDQIVNANAAIRLTDGEMQANNTLVLLRSARRRGELADTLYRLANTPSTLISPKRRMGYARKWLCKLNKEKES